MKKFIAWNAELNKMSKPFSFNQLLNFDDTNIKTLSDEIVLQFTERLDHKSLEIYEHDVVQDLIKILQLDGFSNLKIFTF